MISMALLLAAALGGLGGLFLGGLAGAAFGSPIYRPYYAPNFNPSYYQPNSSPMMTPIPVMGSMPMMPTMNMSPSFYPSAQCCNPSLMSFYQSPMQAVLEASEILLFRPPVAAVPQLRSSG